MSFVLEFTKKNRVRHSNPCWRGIVPKSVWYSTTQSGFCIIQLGFLGFRRRKSLKN